ncbi:LamB/YcsF family protein [Ornithinibacillus xuwenensis]|uniref:5-oxoprolinase subunit A n=1 Tax=Ornithinibacillus xuwenensis TaxID=3144668 RepID=A0ABU9XK89_9BACI
MTEKRIDLNCDMGESYGVYTFGGDQELMNHITSANIACGAHAGDPNVMHQTVALAKKNGVSIGAHPGFPDIVGFGRRKIEMSPEEIYRWTIFQIGSLQAFCKAHHVALHHVKPHGALYHVAARNKEAAKAIAQAVYDVDNSLILYGLAGSELLTEGRKHGLTVASEVFADRTYQKDGTLTPRTEQNALIHDPHKAIEQVKRMIVHGKVEAVDGSQLTIEADTICIHGDNPQAISFAERLQKELIKLGIDVMAIGERC